MHIIQEDTIAMTKKDYIALAADLHIDYIRINSAIVKNGYLLAVSCMCDALQRNNSRFDRQKFMDAVINGTAKKGKV